MNDPVKNPYIDASQVGQPQQTGYEFSLTQHVRTGQIITFALIMGVLVMIGILSMFAFSGEDVDPTDANPLLLWIGLGVAAAAGVVSYLFTTLSYRQAVETFRQQASAEDAAAAADKIASPAVSVLLTKAMGVTLAGQSILEGAAVINLILMLLDRNPLHLVAVAVMIIGMLMHTPTIAKRQALMEEGMR